MAIYFQGNEKEDFPSINAPNGWSYINDPGGWNRSYVRSTNRLLYTDWCETDTFSATDFYTHFFGGWGLLTNASPTYPIMGFYSGSTCYLGLWFNNSNGNYDGKYWNGSSWVTIFSSNAVFYNAAYNWDFYIKVGTSGTGEFKVYYNNQVIGSTNSLDTTFGGAVSSFTKVRMGVGNNNGVGAFYFSEVIVADWPTLGARLPTISPNAAGTYTEFAGGSYTAIDDLGLLSDFLTSNTANERMSAGFTDLSALGTGESIVNVKVLATASRDTVGPQNANLFTRISATDYHGSDQAVQTTLAAVPRPVQNWATSPATSSLWTVTEINAAEFGMRSRT